MVEQYNENQYDDDLTDGSAEYDDSYYTGAEDLFDYTPDEESPISRLKSLVLSIDWEITDDVLMEFNEELVDLKDIWAGEKIHLVYVQALEKLSKYIYQKKADSHPSAIKLLLTLYHNLEKIVSSEDLSEAEKKAILLEDVKRFEDLKTHLRAPDTEKTEEEFKVVVKKPDAAQKTTDGESKLLRLKAIVLGIDWEITDEDLSALRQEVVRLEALFAGSRPRLILLQGIGTIGAYIKVKKSDSHADAFKVLHLFYDSLEKIVDTPMSIEEEKSILFPAVEKFNEFKALLGDTISPASISRSEKHNEDDQPGRISETVAPAFSDFSEDEVMGFQADKEAAALGIDNPDNVNSHITDFFGEDTFVDERETTVNVNNKLENQFVEEPLVEVEDIDKKVALQGVDVEEGDEDDVEDVSVLASEGKIAPALSFDDDSPVAQVSDFPDDAAPAGISETESTIEDNLIEVTFADDGEDEIVADFSAIDKNVALQGVDVESDADDDSDEDALPLLEGELAPALADNDEVSVYNAETLAGIPEPDGLGIEIADTVLDFFEEDGEVDSGEKAFEDSVAPGPLKLDEDLSFESETEVIATLSDDIGETLNDDFPASHEDFDADSPVSLKSSYDDEQNEDLSSDIEGQLDDFFGNDEITTPDSADEMFASRGFSDGGSESSDDIQDDVAEEEVVFELVEESIAIDDVLTAATVAASVAAVGGIAGIDSSESKSTIPLENLAICIEATGVELEDNVLNGLLDEINNIEQELNEKPLEKTFLYLLRTVASHIDRYRYEAGSQAYDLLKSVFDALVLSQSAADQSQDLLLAQTVRVLDWQQEIIAGDSNKTVDSSVRSEPMFVQELDNSDDPMLTFEDDLLGVVGNEMAGDEPNPGDLKDEISNLRKSLQDEISVLKKGQQGE